MSQIKSAFKKKARHTTTSFSIQKKFGFDNSNVIRTSHIPVTTRDYGFMRATNTGTPFPTKKEAINPNLLYDTLHNTFDLCLSNSTIEEHAMSSSISDASDESESKPTAPKKPLSFERKRKLFDEAEFTITRGKKTSENIHPKPDFMGEAYHKDSMGFNHEQFEEVCRLMNFNITFGGFT